MMNNCKKYIPNIITTLRIVLALIFPVVFIYNKTLLSLVIFMIAALSDALDGFLARRWKVITNYGQKLDPIADKSLSCSALILTTVYINYWLLTILMLELFVIINNIFLYVHNKNIHVSRSGKVKTTILFITISIAIISKLYPNLSPILYTLIFITVILQCISINSYIINYKKVI